MDELESKLGQLLGNPEAMGKIMALAQSLNAGAPESQAEQRKQEGRPGDGGGNLSDIDLSVIRKLSGFAKQSGIDKNEQTLLKALGPYLSRERIIKLEKAMRAAKMARMATYLLGASGSGR